MGKITMIFRVCKHLKLLAKLNSNSNVMGKFISLSSSFVINRDSTKKHGRRSENHIERITLLNSDHTCGI